jgi:small subunit ribosomal protein S2
MAACFGIFSRPAKVKRSFEMGLPQVIQDLLDNGVHFGHLSKHWNPKMKKFIFGKKKNVFIIDLEKTEKCLETAKEFARKTAQDGEQILFVSTKKQTREAIKEAAETCNMLYINERWVGGFLTNFPTIRGRIKWYLELTEKKANGDLEKIPRKEAVALNREWDKMDRNYRGVKNIQKLPGCVFVVDPKKESACLKEAVKLGIPVVALIDTDSDPDAINYPIPGNDDAIRSVQYISMALAKAIKEGADKGEALIREKAAADLAAAAAAAEDIKLKEPDVEVFETIEEEIVEKEKAPAVKKAKLIKE